MIQPFPRWIAWFGILVAIANPAAGQQERIVRATLAYQAPIFGRPRPNFSPYGTQVKLFDLPSDVPVPEGAAHPAKTGTLPLGPEQKAWIPILATADAAHPQDLCRLYIDRNRNGNFTDDGPALTATLSLNQKTKVWRSNFNTNAEVSIPYGNGVVEPYMVEFWAVREGAEPPDVIRYSVRSWRSGTVKVDGVEALVAVMDADNNAMFDARDKWSVLAASGRDAWDRVLSHTEARPTNRFMFLEMGDGRELVLEFRGLSPDGRLLSFAIVDRSIRKAADRAPDDRLAAERARPRTSRPFVWIRDFEAGLAQAKESGRKLIVDFWTSWCVPCKSLDEWIFSDAKVAAVLNAGYVGVKIDGDLEKTLVNRFHVAGYPTILVLDSSGNEVQRFNYRSSTEMLELLKR